MTASTPDSAISAAIISRVGLARCDPRPLRVVDGMTGDAVRAECARYTQAQIDLRNALARCERAREQAANFADVMRVNFEAGHVCENGETLEDMVPPHEWRLYKRLLRQAALCGRLIDVRKGDVQ